MSIQSFIDESPHIHKHHYTNILHSSYEKCRRITMVMGIAVYWEISFMANVFMGNDVVPNMANAS